MGRKRTTRRDLPSRVYFKHGAYYFVDQNSKWHRLGIEYYQAIVRYAELNQTDIPDPPLSIIMDRYIKEVIPEKAPTTQNTNLSEIRLLRGVFGHIKPRDLTPRAIYQYLENRPRTRGNREIALLSHILTKSIRWGFCSENVCRLVERNKEKPRERYVVDEEFWFVYDLASPTIQKLMILVAITGLRMTDIVKLHTDMFTDDGLMVQTGKTGKKLLFRWTPCLVQISDESEGYLLKNRFGDKYTVEGLKANWGRLMDKAVKQGLERYQFRDLRAKAGSDHEDGKLLGHTDERTRRRHYRRKPEAVTPINLRRS